MDMSARLLLIDVFLAKSHWGCSLLSLSKHGQMQISGNVIAVCTQT